MLVYALNRNRGQTEKKKKKKQQNLIFLIKTGKLTKLFSKSHDLSDAHAAVLSTNQTSESERRHPGDEQSSGARFKRWKGLKGL